MGCVQQNDDQPRQDKRDSISSAMTNTVSLCPFYWRCCISWSCQDTWCHSATGFVIRLTCYWISKTMQSVRLFVMFAA